MDIREDTDPDLDHKNVEFCHVAAKFSSVFKFTIANSENITGILDETRLVLEMYSNRELYSRLSRSFCIIYDVGLAKGGSEAIVVMKWQQHHGSLSNSVLVARTSIDWHLPVSPQGVEDLIDEATVFHSEKRNVPISKYNFGLSKVMKRLKGDSGKGPKI